VHKASRSGDLAIGKERAFMKKRSIVYERASTGWGAYVPDFPGLGVVGKTREGTKILIQEGITFHLEGMKRERKLIAKSQEPKAKSQKPRASS
jgi:predicted RNase H-like HicB family nuclease